MEQTGIKTPKNVGALQPKGKAAVEKKGKQNTVVQWLSDPTFRSQLETALPKFLNADTFIRNALTDFRKQPLLQQCSTPSVLGYYMAAAQCGLTPGTTLGQCYAVPFRNKNTGQMECEFIIGYRGMLSIVRRSGEVASVEAKAVYEKDKIEVIDGVNPNIIHERYMGGDRGAFVGAYCIVRFKDKDVEPVMEYMSKFEIDKHRRRSKAANSGPWVTDYDEMAKKGLAVDTPIPTPYGWKTMGDIQVGDQVYDMNGAITEVVAVSEVKHLPCYEVTYSNSEKIVCDNEHRWYAEFGSNAARNVRERGWNVHTIVEMIEAKEEGKAVTVPVARPVGGVTKEMPIHPWLLGYWLGDGSSSGAAISCNLEWADEVAERINETTPYKVENITPDSRGSNVCQINVKDGLKVALREAGLLGNKHIPDEYMTADIPHRMALLQGLMDSDGCIEKERGRAKFCSTDKALADGVFELASSLGEVCHRYESDANGFGKTVRAYWVEWQPSVLPPVSLKHHVDKLKMRQLAQYMSIKSIVPVESVPTKCIAVASETESYLCGKGYNVTHNTVFRSMFKWLPISIEQVMAVTSDGGNVKYNEKAENPDDVLEITFSTPEDSEEVAADEALAEGAEVPEQSVEDAVKSIAEQMKME